MLTKLQSNRDDLTKGST